MQSLLVDLLLAVGLVVAGLTLGANYSCQNIAFTNNCALLADMWFSRLGAGAIGWTSPLIGLAGRGGVSRDI